MGPVLPDRLPWFVGDPCIGLLVVALYAVANRPLGVSSSYMQAWRLGVRPRGLAPGHVLC